MTVLPPLVSAEELANRLADPAVRIIDIRSQAIGGGLAAFEAGHIPGAVHSDYAGDGWRVKLNGAPGIMPSADVLARLIGRLGLTSGMQAVIVCAGIGASDFAAAARVCWTLEMAGHAAVSILEGGMSAWVADAARPLERGAGRPSGADLYPVRLSHTLRAEAGDVLAIVKGHAACLIDARSPGYFAGREKAGEALSAGHIPGAINIDYVTAYDSKTQRLKDRQALEQLFADLPQGPLVSYCNTGHTAALNWFALEKILGRPTRLYDGSMTDWTQDTTRPVVNPSAE